MNASWARNPAHSHALRWLIVPLLAILLLLALAPQASAFRAFSERFAVTDRGDLQMIGNTAMTCPIAAPGCAAGRAGTGTPAENNNNGYAMEYVDVDGDATTFSSSSADLTLPAGATVLFAGLYWGGESSATDPERGAVKLDTPGPGGYSDLTAQVLDTEGQLYHAFEDVTAQVAAAGSGTYTVANLRGNPGINNMFGGWSLVIAYQDSASPRQNIIVFDGLQRATVFGGVSIPVSGLTTPDSGPVNTSFGFVSYESDAGAPDETVTLDGTTISDSLNPANNVMNSSITRRGTRISAKNPDYVNQLGYDVDLLAADGILTPGSTSATVEIETAGDVIDPGVLAFVTESETDPPETSIAGPSLTNDPTPSFDLISDEPGSTFECRIDGGTWAACDSPHTTSSLSDGPHTLEARATDLAGNVDPTPASHSLHGRHGASRHHDRRGPVRRHRRFHPDFQLRGQRARIDLSVPDRRRRVVLMRLPLHHPRARRWHPHPRGPGR